MSTVKYPETRRFVVLKDAIHLTTTKQDEIDTAMAKFANKSFSRQEWVDFVELIVKSRPGYGSKGGTNYAKLEASRGFGDWFKKGIIRELV